VVNVDISVLNFTRQANYYAAPDQYGTNLLSHEPNMVQDKRGITNYAELTPSWDIGLVAIVTLASLMAFAAEPMIGNNKGFRFYGEAPEKGFIAIFSPSVTTVMAPFLSVRYTSIPSWKYRFNTSGWGSLPIFLSPILRMAYVGLTLSKKGDELEEELP
jgi:hypothetical protein